MAMRAVSRAPVSLKTVSAALPRPSRETMGATAPNAALGTPAASRVASAASCSAAGSESYPKLPIRATTRDAVASRGADRDCSTRADNASTLVCAASAAARADAI